MYRPVHPSIDGTFGACEKRHHQERHLLETIASTALHGQVRARLIGEHGLGDTSFEMIHDRAHALDLLVDDAHKTCPYVKNVIHPVIKAVYSHFSRSPHKLRHMKALVDAWGAADLFRELHYLFEVRFVESEYLAISNFLQTLPALVAALEKELSDDDITSEMRAAIQGWLRKMKQFKFADARAESARPPFRSPRGASRHPGA